MTEAASDAHDSVAEDLAIDEAIKHAVREALDRHARLGEDVVIFLDGRVQTVPAKLALQLHDECVARERAGPN